MKPMTWKSWELEMAERERDKRRQELAVREEERRTGLSPRGLKIAHTVDEIIRRANERG